MPDRTIRNVGLDAYSSLASFVQEIIASFGAIGFPRPAILTYTKRLTSADLHTYLAAGLPVILIFEIGAEDTLGGAERGTADGQLCVSQLAALDRVPAGAAVYVTSDTDVLPEQLDVAEAYFVAFDELLFAAGYRIGGYADGTELSRLRADGLNFTWLAGAMGWDGSREFLANASPDIVQGPTNASDWFGIRWPHIAGLSYDPNVIFADDVGQITG